MANNNNYGYPYPYGNNSYYKRIYPTQTIDPSTLLKLYQADPYFATGAALGNILGTVWARNYDARGIKKAAEAGEAGLEAINNPQEAQLPQAPQQAGGDQYAQMFQGLKSIKNPYADDGFNLQDASKALDNLSTNGEYASALRDSANKAVPITNPDGKPLTIGDAMDLQAAAKQANLNTSLNDYANQGSTVANNVPSTLNWDKDAYIAQWKKQQRAEGRTNYQINKALEELKPALEATERKVGQQNADYYLSNLLGANGEIDLNTKENIQNFRNMSKADPTTGALVLKKYEQQEKDKLQDKKYQQQLQIAANRGSGLSSGSSKADDKALEYHENIVKNLQEQIDGGGKLSADDIKNYKFSGAYVEFEHWLRFYGGNNASEEEKAKKKNEILAKYDRLFEQDNSTGNAGSGNKNGKDKDKEKIKPIISEEDAVNMDSDKRSRDYNALLDRARVPEEYAPRLVVGSPEARAIAARERDAENEKEIKGKIRKAERLAAVQRTKPVKYEREIE